VEGVLREIDYKIDSDHMLKIVPENSGFTARVQDIPSKAEVAAVTGRVDDSLFNAVEDAGESAELAMRLAQIFGYDLDFYTDPRKGDTFRLVLEKKEICQRPAGWLWKDTRSGVRKRRQEIPGVAVPRSRGSVGILFSGWEVAPESVSPLAAEIRRAGDVSFQPDAFSSHLEDLSAAHGDGLRRSGRDARSDNRERPRGLRWAQRRRRQHGTNHAP